MCNFRKTLSLQYFFNSFYKFTYLTTSIECLQYHWIALYNTDQHLSYSFRYLKSIQFSIRNFFWPLEKYSIFGTNYPKRLVWQSSAAAQIHWIRTTPPPQPTKSGAGKKKDLLWEFSAFQGGRRNFGWGCSTILGICNNGGQVQFSYKAFGYKKRVFWFLEPKT